MLNTPHCRNGMVTAPHHLASQSGLAVLKDGGTAVEACVAIAATLAVVYPHMTGIGGDGFWIVHEPDGRIHAIDSCGAAAAGATLDLYAGHEAVPWRGPLAANTVAGTIAGWQLALEQDNGTLSLERILRDAIGYAEDGVAVTLGGACIARSKHDELSGLPGAYAAIFEPKGHPLRNGEMLRQSALAQTLRTLAQEGLQDYYTGSLSRSIAADLERLGSPLRSHDFAQHRAFKPNPLHVRIGNAELFNTAPPTQGFSSLMILALFDRLGVTEAESFNHVHGLIEATKQAFLVRDEHVGDPVYMSIDPQAMLDDSDILDELAANINRSRAMPWPRPSQQGDTTWFGAADGNGQVVSCIQSTYFEFGSGLVLPETGITWQNRGASFRLAKEGWNALKPGRKPFHTLNPAMARFDDGRIMSYGTMGGEGQPQTQSALFSRYAMFDVPLQEAITRPRWLLGRSWGEQSTTLKLENRISPDVLSALRNADHDLEILSDFTAVMGHAGAVVRYPSGMIEGATDPRSDGAAVGW